MGLKSLYQHTRLENYSKTEELRAQRAERKKKREADNAAKKARISDSGNALLRSPVSVCERGYLDGFGATCFDEAGFLVWVSRRTTRLNASRSSLQPSSRAVRMNLSFWFCPLGASGISLHLKAMRSDPSRRAHLSIGARLAIRQPLALDPSQHPRGALAVTHAMGLRGCCSGTRTPPRSGAGASWRSADRRPSCRA